jgi:hypothetical protein
MKPLLVHRDTSIGRCRSCGAVIEWVELPSGSRMPFNPPVVFLTSLDIVGADDYAEVDRARSVSHFATCPDAATWRRNRARP